VWERVPRRTAAECPAVRRRSRAHASQDGRRTAALKPSVPSLRLPIKVAHRPAPCRPQHTPAALPVHPTEVPLLRPFRRNPPSPRSSTRPLQPPCATRASSQTERPPEQGSPRPRSLCAAGRPAVGAPPPTCGHKPVVGKPLALPHSFPGQTRHRSRPILAGTAASMAKGYIASPSFFPGCFS
jgi:hypothetical protein